MPEENTGGQSPQAGGSQPNNPQQSPQAGDPQKQPQAGDPGDDDSGLTLDSAKDLIKKLRAENASKRTENKTLAQTAKELADWKTAKEAESLTETQRAQAAEKAATEKLAGLMTQLARQSVDSTAQKLGVKSPALVYDLVKDGLEFGNDGLPTNADSLVKDLLKRYPELSSPAQTSGSPANSGGGNGGPPMFKESQLADANFYNANRAAIIKAMAEGRIVRGE